MTFTWHFHSLTSSLSPSKSLHPSNLPSLSTVLTSSSTSSLPLLLSFPSLFFCPCQHFIICSPSPHMLLRKSSWFRQASLCCLNKWLFCARPWCWFGVCICVCVCASIGELLNLCLMRRSIKGGQELMWSTCIVKKKNMSLAYRLHSHKDTSVHHNYESQLTASAQANTCMHGQMCHLTYMFA